MRIFNENKTTELNRDDLDFDLGFLKPERLFKVRHEAVEGQEAVYTVRAVVEESGGTSIYKDLVSPAVEAKEAWDEYEDIQIFVPFTSEERKDHFRRRRETECFPIINRGQLWYDMLTAAQKADLKEWYTAWLNVTETLVAPVKPSWLEVENANNK